MANETVRIFIGNQDIVPSPIEGVLVKVFDSTGEVFITQNYSTLVGNDAVADFSLEGDDPPVVYQIRMFKQGVAFDGTLGDSSKSPQLIEVYSPPSIAPNESNDFLVYGQTFVRPASSNTRMCRLSGFFRRVDGVPCKKLPIIITPMLNPTIVDGELIVGKRTIRYTNDLGYIEFDLYKSGVYSVSFGTMEDQVFELCVPNASSANIVELIFVTVSNIVFSPPSVSLSVGEAIEVSPTVTASNGKVLTGSACADVTYSIANEDVATVSVTNDKLIITGVSAGVTQLSAVRRGTSIVVVPDNGINYTPVGITVS